MTKHSKFHHNMEDAIQILFYTVFKKGNVLSMNLTMNKPVTQQKTINKNPTTLGLAKSFGFGDRLGLATPGHLAACKKFDFAPIFAQQSIREMQRTQRTPTEVMTAAREALAQGGYEGTWGADADHLKTPEDIQYTSDAGFCFFTIDPSAYVNNQADHISASELELEVQKILNEGALEKAALDKYLTQTFEISSSLQLKFNQEKLSRAVVKYGRAIAHSAAMATSIASICNSRPYEIEVSVDETDSATSELEHLFFGLELKRRGAKVVSLAPRFIGEFEKGIDYKGDIKRFEESLKSHVAIAKFCGPYKISVHSGSDKFSVYPIIGRVCGDLLHVKTAGTSYLEALRAIARVNPSLFDEIISYSRSRFDEDRKSYHISTTSEEVLALPKKFQKTDEALFLDERIGRQLLHITFGSVLTKGLDSKNKPFKTGILEILEKEKDLHSELLESHFSKHLSFLTKG